jgi:hypothetical protein
LSYAYTLGGTSIGTGGSLIIRLVKPDGTTADLSTVTLPAAAVPWTYSTGITVDPTLFTQSGTYKLRVVNRLVAAAKGTSNYVQLNFDDIGLSIDTVNYELDLEVQWVNANYTRTYKYLCIRTGTLDSENLRVDVWTGSSWTTVITALTANAWNNVSVSDYLTSSTFTIRFKGTEETNDLTQSSWQIDCVLLHTWSAVADTTPPTYSNVGVNTTKAGQPCLFSIKWTDNVGLSSFIFGWNASGTWQNDTKVTLSGTTAWSNVSKVLPLADAVIGWRIWCNDTSNNWNDTGIQVLITSGALVQPTDTAKQTAIFQACVEEAVLTIQTLLASGQLVWGGEWKVSMSELALTSGTQLYWQEHVYTYPQTAVMPSDLKLWMDALYSFPASMSQLASLQPSGEASFTKMEIICQTDSAKALQELIYIYPQTMYSAASLAYWQEHIHEYSQITFHTATITYNVEGIVAFEVTVSFTETVNQNGVLQYWIEGVYVFIKKMTVNETVTYFQELHYPFSTSLTQSGTVQYWQEQAYRIDQPMRSQTALQTYGEGVVLTVQTIKPYESVLYWQEHSRSFQETSSLSIFLQSFGEGISLIVQTVSPTGLVSYVQEQIYTYPQTVGQSELNQVASEGIYTLSQTLKPSEQHIYGGEGVSVIIQTVKPSEMTVYMQEQKYSFIEQTVQTYSLQYWIEGIQQFYETFMETAKSADMFKYWMELSQAFYEPFKPSASTSYSAEALSVIVQTVKPSEITIYWQEQVYVYPQTAKLPESHPIAGEGVYALSQTLKPSDQTLYGGEGQNIMVQTITSTGSVKYWQEQQYFTGETAKTSSILSVLKEMAETFITQIDTVHLTESPFWLFEGPGAPPFVPPAPSVTPSIVPPVQPTPTPVLPYRYAPVIAGSIIAMAVIGIVAYEKSKPPSTSSRKVAAVWSKRQTENSKKAPPKIKRENRFQTVKVKRKNRFRTVED